MTPYQSIYAKPLTDAECKRYRQFVASLPCACCNIEDSSQCAHYSGQYSYHLGKGMAQKCNDLMTFPLCHAGANGCHAAYDGHSLSFSDEHALFWIASTINAAANAGILRIPA